MASDKTIGRLSRYRRILYSLQASGKANVYSHELARLARGTAAQVRRDLMVLGCTGSPTHGYDVDCLIESVAQVLDAPEGQRVALVGIGNLGRAVLAYFVGRRPKLSIVAAFDKDPQKVERVTHGCPCLPMDSLGKTIREKCIEVGIITVPAGAAQEVADTLCEAGVMGLLNFAPVRLWVPSTVYVEDIDVTMSLEKVAFFARQVKAGA